MTQDPRGEQNRAMGRASGLAGDPRNRGSLPRNTDRQVGDGLVLDEEGRITLRLPTGSPLYINERGELELAVADGIALLSGSRNALRLNLADDSMEVTAEGKVRARPSTRQIRSVERTAPSRLLSDSLDIDRSVQVRTWSRAFLLGGM